MKTVIIYDSCGQEEIKFRVVEGDFTHLNQKYGNSCENTEQIDNEINSLLFNSEWCTHEDFTTEFPYQAVIDGAKVVVIGFLP